MFNDTFPMDEFHRILANADALLDAGDSEYLEHVAEAAEYLDKHYQGYIPAPLTF